MAEETRHAHNGSSDANLFQILILFLSVFVLATMAAQAFVPMHPAMFRLLDQMDTLICFVFLGDVVYRFIRAENRARFMFWGWIDIVSSIPSVSILRLGRVVRIVRLLRVLRTFRSVKILIEYLYSARRRAAVFTAISSTFLIALFSSIAILNFEQVPDGADALWWSFYSLLTQDYPSWAPVTAEGKLIKLLLTFAGMVLFGVFAGYTASYFMEDTEKKEASDIRDMRQEIEKLRAELKEKQ